LKLLLDTPIWLWSLLDPGRLSPRVRHELKNPANELWLSPISTWEAYLSHAKRRIRLHGNLREWATAAASHMREAPLTHEVVMAAQQLALEHPDPADRFLAATAEVLALTLVTADVRLLGLGTIGTLGNS
jgi:PIN domain nuclease of toxin-antitoxin system